MIKEGFEVLQRAVGKGISFRGGFIRHKKLYVGEGSQPSLLKGLKPKFNESLLLPRKPRY